MIVGKKCSVSVINVNAVTCMKFQIRWKNWEIVSDDPARVLSVMYGGLAATTPRGLGMFFVWGGLDGRALSQTPTSRLEGLPWTNGH